MNGGVSSENLSESDIIRRLNLSGHDEISDAEFAAQDVLFPLASPRPAAVLVPLIRMPIDFGGPGWHILYTRRTELVQHHKGQVSFPGGRASPGDSSLEATALREAFEEIGLHPSHVRILGRMGKLMTGSNHLITPVVGIIPWPYKFTVEPNEVSRVFTIPIDWLADSAHYTIHPREFPPDSPVPPQFRRLQIICFTPYHGEVLWGATAEVTLRLIERLEVKKTPGPPKEG
jgi:8-oxo-dGTP pyrophosphatase MutT (NUDIX family)